MRIPKQYAGVSRVAGVVLSTPSLGIAPAQFQRPGSRSFQLPALRSLPRCYCEPNPWGHGPIGGYREACDGIPTGHECEVLKGWCKCWGEPEDYGICRRTVYTKSPYTDLEYHSERCLVFRL